MINEKINKGIKELKKIEMSEEENSAVFSNLMNHFDKTFNDNSSKFAKFPFYISPYFNLFSLRNKFVYATFSFAGLFLVGSFALFGASRALPGDMLYPVKTKVFEKIQSALLIEPLEKADFEAIKAETRLEEVEALVKKNDLNQKKREGIEKNFEDHTKAFSDFAQDAEVDSLEGAVGTRIKFEKKINKHSEILDKIKKEAKEEQKEEVERFDDVVKEKALEISTERKEVEMDLWEKTEKVNKNNSDNGLDKLNKKGKK